MTHVSHERVQQCIGNGCAAVLMAILRRHGVEFQLILDPDGWPAWQAGFVTRATGPGARHAIGKLGGALAHHADRALLLLLGELGGRN